LPAHRRARIAGQPAGITPTEPISVPFPSHGVAKGRGYRCRPEERAKETTMKHIIAVLLENEPGALSRVVACSRPAATTSRA
jgi:hypothetical protein